MMTLKVKAEYNRAAKMFPQIAKRLPSLTRDSINKTATIAESEAIKTVAAGDGRNSKLPIRFVRNRYDVEGRAKERRTKIRRATTANLSAELSVYMRGLPVFQVAGKEVRRPSVTGKGRGLVEGVKATSGRFYKGAFYMQTKRGQRMVFKRRDSAGSQGGRFMMPKIGVRERLTKEYNRNVSGLDGQRVFRREYQMRIQRQLSKAGVRA